MPWLALLALESYQHLWVSYSPYCASHAMADASNKGNDGDDKNTNTTSLTQSIAGGIFAIGVILFIVCEILSAASKNFGCYDFSQHGRLQPRIIYIFAMQFAHLSICPSSRSANSSPFFYIEKPAHSNLAYSNVLHTNRNVVPISLFGLLYFRGLDFGSVFGNYFPHITFPQTGRRRRYRKQKIIYSFFF